jgi:trk system potassium uptake protein TrkA
MRRYLIAGCGQVGAGLARALALQGHLVSVLDPDPRELQRLGRSFAGQQLAESPLDRDALVRAGIERCDGLAAVFHNDARNVTVALAARRIFRVPRVVARLHHARLSEIYHRLGIVTLAPQRWGVSRLVHLLCRSPFEVVTSLAGLDVVEVRLPERLAGRTVAELAVPHEIQVIVVVRDGRELIAEPSLQFAAGDVLYVLVRGSAVEQLRNLLGVEAQ